MSRVRRLLLCLMMLALPLQSYAAAAMLYCGMSAGQDATPAQMQTGLKQAHSHLAMAPAAVTPDAPMHTHTHARGPDDTAVQVGQQSTDGQIQLPDSAHKCGVCASCCSVVAISDFPLAVDAQRLPQANLTELFVLIPAVPSRLPEKPPRA